MCTQKSCRDSYRQPFYCVECSQDSGKHEHKSITIANEMDRAQHRWVTLRGMYEKASDSIEAKAYEQEGLINYLQ